MPMRSWEDFGFGGKGVETDLPAALPATEFLERSHICNSEWWVLAGWAPIWCGAFKKVVSLAWSSTGLQKQWTNWSKRKQQELQASQTSSRNWKNRDPYG